MLFASKKKKSKFKLEMNNNNITESDSVKYLGVLIDTNLFGKHILNTFPQLDCQGVLGSDKTEKICQ